MKLVSTLSELIKLGLKTTWIQFDLSGLILLKIRNIAKLTQTIEGPGGVLNK